MVLKGKQLLASTILSLLIMGVLGYNALPEAYCPLEDKTVKYVHMSASNKTVTKVIPEGESWKILDDRCQKGRIIGQWIKINSDLIKDPIICPKECKPILLAYITDCDTGKTDKFICKGGIGEDAECIEDGTLKMLDCTWG